MGCASSHFLDDDDYDLVSAGLGHHIVSLTSTTYGILTTLDHPRPPPTSTSTPTPTPTALLPHPPEVINSWELMAGLDSASTTTALDSSSPSPKQQQPPALLRSIADLDSRIAKPLRALRPLNPNIINVSSVPKPPHHSLDGFERKCPPGGEMAVVVYTTSLRGIRKTFEDCNSVRSALEGVGVRFAERDISMHSGFREELKQLMKGNGEAGVPRVFVKGRYIGGAEEVLRIHEEGGLAKLVEGLPKGKAGAVCKGCGGARFLPCFECSGSCKVVKEEKVVRCPQCNENGLVVCPICC